MNCANSVSNFAVFSTSSNTVSCPKNGTSYHLLLSLSTQDIILTTLLSGSFTVPNFSGVPKVNVCVFKVAAVALTDFLSK